MNAIAWEREIDCEGNILMPGFKNAHSHSGMTAFRSLADDLNLQDWLNTMIFPREAKMTGEDCYVLDEETEVMVDSWDAEKEEIINKIIADGNMQLE